MLLLGAPARADYKDSYKRGLNAADDANWSEVRDLMQQAIAEQAEPAARVRLYGQVWKPYVPQFYLGLAAYRLNDCATAVAQWDNSANQSVLAGLPDLKAQMKPALANCKTKLAQAQTKPPAVVTTLPPPPTLPVPPPTKVEPRTPVVVAPPPKPVASVPPPRPVVPPPPASGVPPPLNSAVADYLAGRYAQVASINAEAMTESRARLHALLVRAAARYTLRLIEGDPQSRLLEGARADVRAVRALNPGHVPDATLFSPRFRTFFNETR